MRWAPSTLVLVILFGCSCTPPPSPPSYPLESFASTEIGNRLIDANYQITLETVIKKLSQEGYSISMMDKALGVINTAYKKLPEHRRNRINISIDRISANTTKVVLTIISEVRRYALSDWEHRYYTTAKAKKVYDSWLNELQRLAEAHSNYDVSTKSSESVLVNRDDQTNTKFRTLVIVSVRSANIRAGASTDTPIVGKVTLSDTLKALSYSNGWFHIEHNDLKGYVYGELVKQMPTPNTDQDEP